MNGRAIRVGVVDSGWRASQWSRRVRPGRAFFDRADPFRPATSDDVADVIGHGTRCAEIILAYGGNVEVVPMRVFSDRLETSPQVLCAALEWACSQRFDVVNLSLSTDRDDARDALYAACSALRRSGALIVAAATNGRHTGYPAVFDGVVGVTIRAQRRDRAARANDDQAMDIVLRAGWRPPPAPRSGGRTHSVPALQSTSQAAAFVSGCAAARATSGAPATLEELRQTIAERFPGALLEPAAALR